MIEERELVVGHISMCLSILMLILSWDEAQSSQANNGSGARKSALQSSSLERHVGHSADTEGRQPPVLGALL